MEREGCPEPEAEQQRLLAERLAGVSKVPTMQEAVGPTVGFTQATSTPAAMDDTGYLLARVSSVFLLSPSSDSSKYLSGVVWCLHGGIVQQHDDVSLLLQRIT